MKNSNSYKNPSIRSGIYGVPDGYGTQSGYNRGSGYDADQKRAEEEFLKRHPELRNKKNSSGTGSN